jgi:hypothetical protein
MIFSGNEKGAARDERRGRRVFANPDLDCSTGGGHQPPLHSTTRRRLDGERAYTHTRFVKNHHATALERFDERA